MDKRTRILGVIPARYGSQRFPGKLLEPLGGSPVITHTVASAKQCPELDALVVATDDQRIADSVDCDYVLTSKECFTGSDRMAEVIRDHPDYADYDVILGIQGDEPFVQASTLSAVLQALSDDAVMATAAVPFHEKDRIDDPHAVKVVCDLAGSALYFSRAPIPYHGAAYHHLGIYAYRREFLLEYSKLPVTPLQRAEDLEQLKVLEHGYRIKVAVVDDVPIGIDTPEDLQRAEQFLCNNRSSSLSPAGLSPH